MLPRRVRVAPLVMLLMPRVLMVAGLLYLRPGV